MKTNIVIVGGGASCISFMDALLKKNLKEKLNQLSLTILEKSKEIGPGNAYFSDLKSNLLNTKAGYITVFKDHPGDFYQWLECNEYKWKPDYPELEITRDTYAPRALFGMYMKDAFSVVCADARRSGIQVKVLRDEAIKVEQVEKDQVNVVTQSGTVINAGKVVLACGTQQQSAMLPPYSHDIIHSPYPTRELQRQVAAEDSVAIIGARLSAIDATIGLIEGGHTGPITIYSRSGYFPFVRGTQGRYKNAYLTPDYIAEHCPELDFYKLGDLYQLERERYQAQTEHDYFEELPLPNPPISNLEEFLTKELALAKQDRGWQAILYDTNSGIDQIWDRLRTEDQDRFMKQFVSSAMSLRVSIPAENAEKMLGYLRSGQLKFVAGPTSVKVEDGQLTVHCNGTSAPTGKVIYATGSPKSLNQIDSPLLRSLIESGTSVENRFGGLDVCKYDYGLFCKDGKMNTSIFAIGELTSGRFLFTSALDIIVRHAHACADSVEKFMTTERDYSLSLAKS
ncbi:FAD/NAD(P)-binding protein [Photobacterium atrarenae]|uniref:FAD/NAD(P)-binding protein n=1 Tax=Photobacterium atrarenae TaxID=865757 RepID=A0ABY5GQJ3_9GAMM|nr:FAD/NAD(P)-binding protein [Photobacterium atrarenae]UTV30792.1 FAD/NAD(P)-binding protein [Photobacterium atrarenae]